MALPGVAIAPGRASGMVRFCDDPLAGVAGHSTRQDVLALPALWWPPAEPLAPEARAVVLHGLPEAGVPAVPIPVIGGIDRDVLREGESVIVDGTHGTLSIDGVEEVPVVTAFLERDDGSILLLQRSEKVGSFQGRWAGVSGFLEDPTPLDQVYREIREETGLEAGDLMLAAAGPPALARDQMRVFVVYPFRFRAERTEVQLDWEHTRAEWVSPDEIRRRPTVPKLDLVWESVAPRPGPKA
jgi:8-oxo-dGTP diphosphatase